MTKQSSNENLDSKTNPKMNVKKETNNSEPKTDLKKKKGSKNRHLVSETNSELKSDPNNENFKSKSNESVKWKKGKSSDSKIDSKEKGNKHRNKDSESKSQFNEKGNSGNGNVESKIQSYSKKSLTFKDNPNRKEKNDTKNNSKSDSDPKVEVEKNSNENLMSITNVRGKFEKEDQDNLQSKSNSKAKGKITKNKTTPPKGHKVNQVPAKAERNQTEIALKTLKIKAIGKYKKKLRDLTNKTLTNIFFVFKEDESNETEASRTPGVNFVNVFCAHFSYERCFSSYILYKKFARLTLMKLTAGVNFINILLSTFLYKSASLSLQFSFEFFWQKNFCARTA